MQILLITNLKLLCLLVSKLVEIPSIPFTHYCYTEQLIKTNENISQCSNKFIFMHDGMYN